MEGWGGARRIPCGRRRGIFGGLGGVEGRRGSRPAASSRGRSCCQVSTSATFAPAVLAARCGRWSRPPSCRSGCRSSRGAAAGGGSTPRRPGQVSERRDRALSRPGWVGWGRGAGVVWPGRSTRRACSIRQLLQPGRDGAASLEASDPRPRPRLFTARVDGEGVDLDLGHGGACLTSRRPAQVAPEPAASIPVVFSCWHDLLRLATPLRVSTTAGDSIRRPRGPLLTRQPRAVLRPPSGQDEHGRCRRRKVSTTRRPGSP